jgi:hypothetical protein
VAAVVGAAVAVGVAVVVDVVVVVDEDLEGLAARAPVAVTTTSVGVRTAVAARRLRCNRTP